MIVLLSCLLAGCFFVTDEPYVFRQEYEQIKTIDILKKQYDSVDPHTPTEIVKTIEQDEHSALINALLETDGSRVGLDPGTGFGLYIIRITYHDGEIELIGDYNNGYITKDGNLHEDIYCFDSEQFYDVISIFLGYDVP